MRLHFEEGLDLVQGQVLPVSHGDEFVEGAEQLEGIAEDLAFVGFLAYRSDHLSEEVQAVNVL